MTGRGFNRRDVLGAGAAGAGVVGLGPLAASASATAVEAPASWVVAEIVAPESRRFATAFGGARLMPVSSAMGELFDGLSGALPEVVVGLTSDPVAMVAEQLLAERGARGIFRWVHRYQNGGWHHQIDAAPAALAGSGATWPAALARLVAARLGADAAPGQALSCGSGACVLARRSPGLLVSWAFQTTRNG